MPGTAHTAIPRRILAAIVALGLSGVPALTVEHLAEGRETRHRCQCPPGHHDCECLICRSAARKARRAGLANLPPCCRSRALEALAREEAQEERGTPGGAPCVRSSCERPEHALPTAAGDELLALPAAAPLRARGWVTQVPETSGTPLSRPLEPELPPPRRA